MFFFVFSGRSTPPPRHIFTHCKRKQIVFHPCGLCLDFGSKRRVPVQHFTNMIKNGWDSLQLMSLLHRVRAGETWECFPLPCWCSLPAGRHVRVIITCNFTDSFTQVTGVERKWDKRSLFFNLFFSYKKISAFTSAFPVDGFLLFHPSSPCHRPCLVSEGGGVCRSAPGKRSLYLSTPVSSRLTDAADCGLTGSLTELCWCELHRRKYAVAADEPWVARCGSEIYRFII